MGKLFLRPLIIEHAHDIAFIFPHEAHKNHAQCSHFHLLQGQIQFLTNNMNACSWAVSIKIMLKKAHYWTSISTPPHLEHVLET